MEEKEISIPDELIDIFDLLDAIKSISEHKHIENLRVLRKILDSRIKALESQIEK